MQREHWHGGHAEVSRGASGSLLMTTTSVSHVRPLSRDTRMLMSRCPFAALSITIRLFRRVRS
ncbi:predicted protein [Streptomyces iranensis]|uniref:Uncharacterized protein n=1 Tax=Streptomyces iranensis TaxID=576784 RepID=A0A060ZTY4_9ACTN|nr:predicted protein [Streptomyces iranensis]